MRHFLGKHAAAARIVLVMRPPWERMASWYKYARSPRHCSRKGGCETDARATQLSLMDWSRRALALAVTIQVSRYSSVYIFGCTTFAVPLL